MPLSAKEQKLGEDMILYNSVRKTGGYEEKNQNNWKKKGFAFCDYSLFLFT